MNAGANLGQPALFHSGYLPEVTTHGMPQSISLIVVFHSSQLLLQMKCAYLHFYSREFTPVLTAE